MLFTRRTIKPYLEYIPDPKRVSWNPCTEPWRFNNTEVQQILSCMARNNKIYIVANIGDRQPCEGAKCPGDGQYQYNSDVVYDVMGNLVARYHKAHLYGEDQFDKPNKTEFITFTTPFGKFGVFTCYDILFQTPAVDLVKKYDVTNMVFPTAWGDELPQLSAIGFHSSFARSLKVNLLAANIHMPIFRMLGSGIYTPDGAISYYYDDAIFSGGKLIFADVCHKYETKARIGMASSTGRHIYSLNGTEIKHIRHGTDFINHVHSRHYNRKGHKKTTMNGRRLMKSLLNTMKYVAQYRQAIKGQSSTSHNQINFARRFTPINNNQFQWFPLDRKFGTLRRCKGKTCCFLRYKIHPGSNKREMYAFGLFDGYDERRYTQICTVVKCPTRDMSSCGKPTKWARTKFKYVKLKGHFSSDYIFPEVVASDKHGIGLDDSSWVYLNNAVVIKKGTNKPVLCISLIARVYSLDKRI